LLFIQTIPGLENSQRNSEYGRREGNAVVGRSTWSQEGKEVEQRGRRSGGQTVWTGWAYVEGKAVDGKGIRSTERDNKPFGEQKHGIGSARDVLCRKQKFGIRKAIGLGP